MIEFAQDTASIDDEIPNAQEEMAGDNDFDGVKYAPSLLLQEVIDGMDENLSKSLKAVLFQDLEN